MRKAYSSLTCANDACDVRVLVDSSFCDGVVAAAAAAAAEEEQLQKHHLLFLVLLVLLPW